MSKTIKSVFIIIGVLVLCLAVWAVFFSPGGLLSEAWNGVAQQVNTGWNAVTGEDDGVMNDWNANGNANVAQQADNATNGTLAG